MFLYRSMMVGSVHIGGTILLLLQTFLLGSAYRLKSFKHHSCISGVGIFHGTHLNST